MENTSLMENKTSYTLQDAKNEVGVRHGYKSWFGINLYAVQFTESELYQEAAELYKEKATEELRKENEEMNERLAVRLATILEANKEIERLTQSNKELEEWKRQQLEVTGPIFEWGQSQKDITVGTSIIKEVLRRLEEYKVLKGSNKELVEALQTIIEVIMLNGMYNIAPVTIKDCLELIKNNNSKP